VATGRITAVTTGDSVTLSFFFVGIGLPYVRAYLYQYQSEQHATPDDLRRKAIAFGELVESTAATWPH